MVWRPTLYTLLGISGAGISVLVAGVAWRLRDQRTARSLVLLMAALSSWSLVYAIQLGFTTAAEQVFWQRLSLAVGGSVPTLWLLFTLQYAGKDGWLTPSRIAVLVVDPLLFALVVLTNPIHEVVWRDTTWTRTLAGPALRPVFRTGYLVHISYAYLLVAAGLAILVTIFLRTSRLSQRQTGVLILSAIPPFASNIAYTLRFRWGPLPAVDPTPFAFAITGALLAVALFEFDLLERAPIARRHILEEMGAGLVVLDADGHVVESNEIAKQALDLVPAVGCSFVERWSDDATSVEAVLDAVSDRSLSVTTNDGHHRVYDPAWSSLTNHRDETIGYSIVFRDVTDRHTYEQHLEVAQRVLRHNLRNDMLVIRGWGEHLTQSSRAEQSVAAERIIDTADDLIDLSEKVRSMVRIEEPTSDTQVVIDTTARLQSLVEEFRDDYPAATIAYDPAQRSEIRVPAQKFFDIPVRNVIENALEHTDATRPQVDVRVEQTVDHLRLHVEDDGPKIPETEREVLEEGTEEPLRHGTGIGLWLTYWSLRAVGGDVSFDRSERGNVVTLAFPTEPVSGSAVTEIGISR